MTTAQLYTQYTWDVRRPTDENSNEKKKEIRKTTVLTIFIAWTLSEPYRVRPASVIN